MAHHSEGQCPTKVLWSAIAVELVDGGPCSSKDKRIINVLEIPEAEDNKNIFVKNQRQKEGQGESPSFVGCEGKHNDKG